MNPVERIMGYVFEICVCCVVCSVWCVVCSVCVCGMHITVSNNHVMLGMARVHVVIEKLVSKRFERLCL